MNSESALSSTPSPSGAGVRFVAARQLRRAHLLQLRRQLGDLVVGQAVGQRSDLDLGHARSSVAILARVVNRRVKRFRNRPALHYSIDERRRDAADARRPARGRAGGRLPRLPDGRARAHPRGALRRRARRRRPRARLGRRRRRGGARALPRRRRRSSPTWRSRSSPSAATAAASSAPTAISTSGCSCRAANRRSARAGHRRGDPLSALGSAHGGRPRRAHASRSRSSRRASDLTACTALLDARFLDGDRAIWEKFAREVPRLFDRDVNGVVKRLAEEKSERHARFGDTVYLLEPNVKNGQGGYRDLLVGLWAAKARFRVRDFADLVDRRAGERRVRCRRWWRRAASSSRCARPRTSRAKRKEDRLTFEVQEAIAPRLFPASAAVARTQGVESAVEPSVEALMQQYFLHAKAVQRETDRLLARCVVEPQQEADGARRRRVVHAVQRQAVAARSRGLSRAGRRRWCASSTSRSSSAPRSTGTPRSSSPSAVALSGVS